MKKIVGLFFAFYLLYLGVDVYIIGKYDAYYGYEVDLGNFKYLVSVIFTFLGFLVIYKTLTIKKRLKESDDKDK
jgi:formate hydrogenlyase subunit 3/multisubunit Na+/H+ antiporter MnhD subunit